MKEKVTNTSHISVNQRIKDLRLSHNLTQEAFSETIGINRATLGQIETGKHGPTLDIINEIVRKYNISYDELLSGRQALLSASHRETVPLVSVDALAGMNNEVFIIQEKDIQAHYLVPDFQDINFMIRVKGNSMYPKYNSGDVVACRIIKERSFIQWNRVHVIATKEQGILIKRLKKGGTSESYSCVSDNPSYDPFELPGNQVDGLALVIGVIRLE